MKGITNINQLDFNSNYSYADYLTWQFKERVELIKGKIFRMSPAPNRYHQQVLGNINRIVDAFFINNTCKIYFAPFDVRLSLKKGKAIITVVQPDLCVICDQSKLDDAGCIGAPDLIVEVLSPGNTKKEMKIKFDLYQENGVKEYWIVDPHRQCILVYILINNIYTGLPPVTENEKLKSKTFNGLVVDLNKVF